MGGFLFDWCPGQLPAENSSKNQQRAVKVVTGLRDFWCNEIPHNVNLTGLIFKDAFIF
jgi:hypothetical protein